MAIELSNLNLETIDLCALCCALARREDAIKQILESQRKISDIFQKYCVPTANPTAKYQVKYYLDKCSHDYLVEAKNEYEAIRDVVDRLPEGSREIMHDFKINRYP